MGRCLDECLGQSEEKSPLEEIGIQPVLVDVIKMIVKVQNFTREASTPLQSSEDYPLE